MRNMLNITAILADSFVVCPISGACFVNQTVTTTVKKVVAKVTEEKPKKAAAPKRAKASRGRKAQTTKRVKRTLKTISATIGGRRGTTPQLVGVLVKSWWVDTRREVRAIVAQLLKGLMSQGHGEVRVVWDRMRRLNLL